MAWGTDVCRAARLGLLVHDISHHGLGICRGDVVPLSYDRLSWLGCAVALNHHGFLCASDDCIRVSATREQSPRVGGRVCRVATRPHAFARSFGTNTVGPTLRGRA